MHREAEIAVEAKGTMGARRADPPIINDMGTLTADYRGAIDQLPDGATLIIHQVEWDDYERLLEELAQRPRLRVSYDGGKLEIMTPLPEHEACARLVDALVRVWADIHDLRVESYGGVTWKRRGLAKGVEPDACYYVTNADRIIGKRLIDLESDPPPDIAVEIDVTNESLGKFPIYAALAVREIWRYDGQRVHFYELAGDNYREVSESPSFAGFTPAMLANSLERAKTQGQTVALRAFRQRWQR